jgi:ABC-type phosphate transport system permease subunit
VRKYGRPRVRLGGQGALLTLALLCHFGVPRYWRLACDRKYRPRLFDQHHLGRSRKQVRRRLVMIYGTIATSLIALLIAVPVSLLRCFLTDCRPPG